MKMQKVAKSALMDFIREGQGSYYFRNGDVFTGTKVSLKSMIFFAACYFDFEYIT